ncbi:MAG: carboxypeptidase-like regulatory domain-containing protein [Candidatus Kapabacteria bacterium]|nr:carboxypeptidase-like regulatory domain-containing protein [Candidatus Kapabacteria bacterium]
MISKVIWNFMLFIVSVIFMTHSIYAQSGGSITGKVIDGESGEVLRRATVMVVGTNMGAFSDVKGEFKLKDVKAGTYNLRFSYVGYMPKEVTGVEVKDGEVVNLNITLEFESKLKDEIVVEARRVFDNEASILAQRKNASQVSDGLSSEQMSKLPDSDAGQSLKRVSGVTLVNNKHIFVRGVSERYSNTTLNGAGLASTEPDKKSFSFDMFPSEFLQNVNVTKSFTPDLPGNFAGGLVQLNTVDFPHGRSFKISLSSNVNTNVTLKDKKFISSTRSSTDWFAKDDGLRALPSNVPGTRLEFNDLQNRAKNPFDTTGARDEYQAISQSFNSDLFKRDESTIGPFDNRSYGMSYTDLFSFGGDELGVIANLTYGNSNSINNVQRNGYLAQFDTLYAATGSVSETNYSAGGLFNLAYKLGESNILNFKNVFNRSADDEVLILEGSDPGYQNYQYKNYSYHFVQKWFYSGSVGGEHNLGLFNSMIDWRAGYSTSERDEPDFKRLRFDRNIADLEFDANTPFRAVLSQTMQGDGTKLGRFYSSLVDDVYSGSINFTIPVSTSKIKFGFLGENRKRDFDARSFTIINPNFLDMEIEDLTSEFNNPEKLFAQENFRYDDGFLIGEESRLSDSYDANEELYAAYLMADIPFSISFGGETPEFFRIIFGARYEDHKQRLNSFTRNDEPVNVNESRQDILPSINFIYQVTKNANIRMSATQTVARPEFREIAPFTFYDYLQQANIQGNPNLVRSLIQNYDLRFEYFPTGGEVASVSLFYKNFENAIEETIFPEQSELSRSFANALGDAKNYGVEFELRKNLGFITNLFSELTFNVNVALITTSIEVSQGGDIVTDNRQMWGQSPYTVNVGLFYQHPRHGTSINVAYNTFGRRIIQVAQQGIYVTESNDPHVYELPRNVIDFSISQPIGNFDIKLSMRDLLNEPLTWRQDEKLVATNLRGSTISLSFGYRVF